MSRRSGKIEYLEEGFIVHWDENGLSIEVTDYHAGVLRLDWKDLLALAKVAKPPLGGRKRAARRPTPQAEG